MRCPGACHSVRPRRVGRRPRARQLAGSGPVCVRCAGDPRWWWSSMSPGRQRSATAAAGFFQPLADSERRDVNQADAREAGALISSPRFARHGGDHRASL